MSRATIKKFVNGIQQRYPTRLADKSFDNTGLLVDASSDEISSDKLKVLLTIDLTHSVVDEALKYGTNIIMAYHPFIFRGLKSITTEDPQQRSLIRLIKNNVSVYSPHTAVDSAVGGVNDFLVDGICKGFEIDSRAPISPIAGEDGCGVGRIVNLKEPAALEHLVQNAKSSLGLSNLMVSTANGFDKSHPIKTLAICAGSGGSVFAGVKADLYYTGELSHHETLYFKESGSSVIVSNHSNSERAFLVEMKKQLQELLKDAEINISKTDKDPLEIW